MNTKLRELRTAERFTLKQVADKISISLKKYYKSALAIGLKSMSYIWYI